MNTRTRAGDVWRPADLLWMAAALESLFSGAPRAVRDTLAGRCAENELLALRRAGTLEAAVLRGCACYGALRAGHRAFLDALLRARVL